MSNRNRHLRIGHLTSMALRGCSYEQMYSKALSWGVTKATADSYMGAVIERIKIAKNKKELFSTNFLTTETSS